MSPLDRLAAEAVPTRPTPPPRPAPWSQQQQDAHWTDLCHAVGTPDALRPTPPENGPQNGTQTV